MRQGYLFDSATGNAILTLKRVRRALHSRLGILGWSVWLSHRTNWNYVEKKKQRSTL